MINDDFRSNAARTVFTNKNTSFAEWRSMVLLEYAKLGVNPADVRPLREKHAYEGGDTTMGWAQHVWHNNKMRERTKMMKLLNG
jgi:hypothetical protein